MDMCKQWFIYGKVNEAAPADYNEENLDQPMYDAEAKHGHPIIGGIHNGYEEQQLKDFWTNIEGFADYLFNKSHAACYSYITVLTAYFKTHYPAKFMASLLTMQDKEEKIEQYVKVARQLGIPVQTPDINLSEEGFVENNGTILYGLNSIKGVGGKSIPAILENRPYSNIQHALDKIDKKSFNKTVGVSLIKAGAFDFENQNRYSLLEQLYTIRKDKDEIKDAQEYTREVCMEMEKEVLGTSITHIPFWDNVMPGETVDLVYELSKIQEKTDKNGNLMAFVDGTCDGCSIRAIVFAKTYCKNLCRFDMKFNSRVLLRGKKDEKGALVVSSVKDAPAIVKENEMDRFEGII